MRSASVIALAALATTAAAQQPGRGPTDPAVAVPAVKYESAFTGYSPYREQGIAPWRDTNDEVARAGGHAGILRAQGMQAPKGSADKPPAAGAAEKSGATAPSAPAAKPPAQGHGGHH